MAKQLCDCETEIDKWLDVLGTTLSKAKSCESLIESSLVIKNEMLDAMNKLRECVDIAETVTSSDYWPYPTYEELLYRQ